MRLKRCLNISEGPFTLTTCSFVSTHPSSFDTSMPRSVAVTFVTSVTSSVDNLPVDIDSTRHGVSVCIPAGDDGEEDESDDADDADNADVAAALLIASGRHSNRFLVIAWTKSLKVEEGRSRVEC